MYESNQFTLHEHEATSKNERRWNELSITPEHGTVDIVECDPHIYARIVKNLPDWIPSYQTMYEDYLAEGVKIAFWIGATHYPLKYIPLIPKGAIKYKDDIRIEVWENPDNKMMYVYFPNADGDMVRWNLKESKQIKGEYPPKEDLGLKKKGDIRMESALDYTHNSAPTWTIEQGGHYFRRGRKVIQRFPIEVPNSGDYGLRSCIGAARHRYTFGVALDSDFAIEVNKSHIKQSNIHPEIYTALMYLAQRFSKNAWNKEQRRIKPTASSATHPSTAVAVATATAVKQSVTAKAAATSTPTTAPPTKAPSTTARPIAAAPTATPSTAVTHVRTHERITSKSQKDVATAFAALRTALDAVHVQQHFESAATTTESKYTELFKKVTDITDYIKGLSRTNA